MLQFEFANTKESALDLANFLDNLLWKKGMGGPPYAKDFKCDF